MKGILYANLIRQSRTAPEHEDAGELMTKAISDVDDVSLMLYLDAVALSDEVLAMENGIDSGAGGVLLSISTAFMKISVAEPWK